jgi:hypothetical protein
MVNFLSDLASGLSGFASFLTPEQEWAQSWGGLGSDGSID